MTLDNLGSNNHDRSRDGKDATVTNQNVHLTFTSINLIPLQCFGFWWLTHIILNMLISRHCFCKATAHDKWIFLSEYSAVMFIREPVQRKVIKCYFQQLMVCMKTISKLLATLTIDNLIPHKQNHLWSQSLKNNSLTVSTTWETNSPFQVFTRLCFLSLAQGPSIALLSLFSTSFIQLTQMISYVSYTRKEVSKKFSRSLTSTVMQMTTKWIKTMTICLF